MERLHVLNPETSVFTSSLSPVIPKTGLGDAMNRVSTTILKFGEFLLRLHPLKGVVCHYAQQSTPFQFFYQTV